MPHDIVYQLGDTVRSVVLVQCDALNASRIGPVVCVTLTSNLKWQRAPGNVLLSTLQF